MFKKLISFLKRLFLRKKFLSEVKKDVASAVWREKHLRDDCSYREYFQRSF